MASSPFNLDGYDASPVTPLFGVPSAASQPVPNIDLSGTSLLPASSAKYEEQSGKHKGVAGVAHDILGFLGDFLLTRLHMPAQYGPSQERRKLAAAEAGLGTTPQATADAISRVTSLNPTMGAKLTDQYIDNQRLQVQSQATREQRDARLALAQQASIDKSRGVAGSYLNTLSNTSEDKREGVYNNIRPKLLAAYGKNDPELANLLPESYDPVAVDAFLDGAVPLNIQRSQRLTENRNGVLERQGDRRLDQGDTRNGILERQGDRRLDQGDRRIDETVRRDTNTDARGNRSLDIRDKSVNNTDRYRGQVLDERKRHNRVTESVPKSGQIVTLPDGTKAKIK